MTLSRLFHAIVVVGSSLGAGCRTPPSVLDGRPDAPVVADLSVPADAAVDACPCPVKCPNPDMGVCGGQCSDGCQCFPCFI